MDQGIKKMNMKLLAYDTSSALLSVAVYDGEKKKGEFESSLGRHSESLAPEIDRLLKKSRLKPANLDCVAVGLGPGSFTGLRIGVTTAKVLAYSLNKKLIGVSSLEAIAREAAPSSPGRVAVLLDAKRSQVYAGIYETDKNFKTVWGPALTTPEKLTARLRQPTLLAGGGAALYREFILKKNNRYCLFAAEGLFLFPKAAGIAEGAWERIKRRQFSDPFTLEPDYLSPRDCNVTK